MFEACTSMVGAPWLCWAIQGTALLLIGLFLWRIVKRNQEGPGTPFGNVAPWDAEPLAVPVRPVSNGPSALYDKP